ncbi:MAG: IS66 family transposase [Ferrovum myxofaciens]|uniref:IS66 family transposase n=5 Tax=Ferrovum myxofaciens TaxID=416213 RepID=A0A9E6SY33_9PROT|nr:IS66 family transposase [Ferrovum myxofaciens]QKE37682.1 MAG: IS66 family transposase [Ferrovum myxofaciens]QWY75343.1 MAG: IS66 family transposase [Ferrovum myxofaciens]QWY78083.1 MAG: IS66 family transposase [Ferrovum myxofaciens]
MSNALKTAANIIEQNVVLMAVNARQQEEISQLKRQLEWFRRHLFGQKSERRNPDLYSLQLAFSDLGGEGNTPPPAPDTQTVAAHSRNKPAKPTPPAEDGLFFDESKLPVETITLPCKEAEGLDPAQYEIVSEKVSHRLAQRPASYVILKYVRPVIKLKETQTLVCAPAPQGVLDNSRADVSFLAGMVVDKFLYHQPLYRQHQRLGSNGVTVSRPWLTQLTHAALELLRPIHQAQLESIRTSRVITMDETPVKAGRTDQGQMKTGYFWPVYGEQDEICFLFYPDRQHKRVAQALQSEHAPADAVLLTDGYGAYAKYATQLGLTHAQCWVHSRRKFHNARGVEPERAEIALNLIGQIYRVEEDIRAAQLTGKEKQSHRLKHSKPVVESFFAWIEEQFRKQDFLPSSPLTEAMGYAREREAGLRVFLNDPEVPPDTNHLERALRVIPMGKKNWNFCWTEVGAELTGVAQSLITTCRLHDINPYDYLVDVLQRVGQHPARDIGQLTPRCWKAHFADNPLRSDLYRFTQHSHS